MSTVTEVEVIPAPQSGNSILEAKLRPPLERSEWVVRTRLLEKIQRASQRTVTLIAAPAGYGKTTAMAQWLASDAAPANIAWVSLDTSDDDPVGLWIQIATVLDRAGCDIARDIAGFVAAGSHDMLTLVLPRIVDAIDALPAGISIFLDDFDVVRSAECHAQIEHLIKRLPSKAHLILMTRTDPALRLGRLRGAGQLSEIRAEDLAFTFEEASSLLIADEVQLSSDAVSELLDRTEGWPAGLYLAALSLTGRADPIEFVHHFSGNNRFIGDYLTEEVLSRQTDDVRNFILDMSIFDRFTAPLADYVTGSRRSASILRELKHTNLFLIPLDPDEHWFRFHHLFAAVARSALETEQPDRAAVLHGRAADWLSQNGQVDAAIEHALAAGRSDQAASLVQASWIRYFDAGLGTTVRRWLRALQLSDARRSTPTVVTAAWLAALSGQKEEMDRLLAHLSGVVEQVALPDGTRSAESAVVLIRGLFGFEGPSDMLASARRAAELETDGNTPWYAVANAALGHASYVVGDLAGAVAALHKAAYRDTAPALIQILALATLALTEAELGQTDRSRRSARVAMEIVEKHSFQTLPHVSMAFTALAQSQANSGEPAEAMTPLEHGLNLRRKVPGLSPWPTIHHMLVMGQVAIIAGNLALARRLLEEVSPLIRQYHQDTAVMMASWKPGSRACESDRPPTRIWSSSRPANLRFSDSSLAHAVLLRSPLSSTCHPIPSRRTPALYTASSGPVPEPRPSGLGVNAC